MIDLNALYRIRFSEADLPAKMKIWQVLCRDFFQKFVREDDDVLDVACGYGEFINNIRAKNKYAVDLNEDVRRFLGADVHFSLNGAERMIDIGDDTIDVAFTSNFLEHLPSKTVCDQVLAELWRVLRPGGRLIIMGPNIRYLPGAYWDFYDHRLPLSNLSLAEALLLAGFSVERNIAKFLPYTTRSRLPQHPILVALFLRFPIAWRLLGKQFLIVARKEKA